MTHLRKYVKDPDQKKKKVIFLQKHSNITRCFLAWFLLLKNSINFFLITWFLENKIGKKKKSEPQKIQELQIYSTKPM